MQTACTSEGMCFGYTISVCSPLIIPIPSQCILLDTFFLFRQAGDLCYLSTVFDKTWEKRLFTVSKAWGIEGACGTTMSEGDVASFGT